jgi:hypothetical protein
MMIFDKIILLVVLVAGVSPCSATSTFSGNFYNSESSLSVSELVYNTNAAGSIKLLPFDGFDEYPFAIQATSKGNSNGGSADAKHFTSISASGNGKTVNTDSILTEDAALRGTISSNWEHEVTLGEECSLHLSTTIRSKPGYLTYPTAPSLDSITAGMTLQPFDNSGLPLFDKKYVPPPEFGDFPLVLGVMKSPLYPDVYMENILDISAHW